MNWQAYRTSHLQEYGPTSRQALSQDYQAYKQSLTKTNQNPPIRSPQKLNQTRFQTRSPTRSVKSPQKLNKTAPISPQQGTVRSPNRNNRNTATVNNTIKKDTNKVSNKKLTLKDIDQLAKGKPYLIVVLYADWCGHCKNLVEKLGPKMKNTDKIMFYNEDKIDNVTTYFPRILYYENGVKQEDLTVDDVYDYLL